MVRIYANILKCYQCLGKEEMLRTVIILFEYIVLLYIVRYYANKNYPLK